MKWPEMGSSSQRKKEKMGSLAAGKHNQLNFIFSILSSERKARAHCAKSFLATDSLEVLFFASENFIKYIQTI